MRFIRSIFAAAVLVMSAAIVLVAAPAVAQEAGTTVSLAPFVDAVSPLLAQVIAALIAAGIGWIGYKLNKALGINIEAKHREALQSALMNGVYKGLHYAEEAAGKVTIDVRSEVVAEGIRYVQRSVPDAIKHFGLTDERIRDLIEAKLPYIEAEAPDA